MRKTILLFAIFLASLVFDARAATQTKISELPDGGAIQVGDVVPVVRGGTTYKGTIESVTAYPSAGIAVSTGSAWGTSITDSHTNWDTAYANRILTATGSSPLSLSLSNNDLSGSLTQATATTAGYLSSTDWSAFNSKQAAITTGTTAQYIRGDLSLASFPTIGTMAAQSSSSVAITGGTLTGITATGTFNGNATSATTLQTTRAISISGSTGLTATGQNFNGSAAISLPLAGTLGIGYGGTGATTAGAALDALYGGTSTGYLQRTATATWSLGTPAGSGSGTVNSGNTNQLAYYSATGTAVSGTSTVDAGMITATTNTQTSSYTLVLTDAGKTVIMNCSSACNLTVPPNSSVAFSSGKKIVIFAYGAGAVTLVKGSGVTIRSPLTLVMQGQYSKVELEKIGTDEWSVEGRLQ